MPKRLCLEDEDEEPKPRLLMPPPPPLDLPALLLKRVVIRLSGVALRWVTSRIRLARRLRRGGMRGAAAAADAAAWLVCCCDDEQSDGYMLSLDEDGGG